MDNAFLLNMDGEGRGPYLKRVLKSYKNSASTSLQGPGAFETKSEGLLAPVDVAFFAPFKKAYFSVTDLGPEVEKLDVWPLSSKKPNEPDEEDPIGPGKDPGTPPCADKDPPWVISSSPKAWPVLSVTDPGSPDSEAGRGNTFLDDEPIMCFYVGGEPRLCLPQVLNSVLTDFHLAEINPVCDDLQIHISRCSSKQLEVLKEAGVLPPSTTSCGLITQTDAHRLTHALLHFNPPLAPARPRVTPFLKVSHACFGKCRGTVWPDLYTDPRASCIECADCGRLFTPGHFVCHAHKNLEKRTCHWGFDPENWRFYLMLAKDQGGVPLEEQESKMEAFKKKFAGESSKRKQGTDARDLKKSRCCAEDASSFLAYPQDLASLWRQYQYVGLQQMPVWSTIPVLAKDGKPLSMPPLTFLRESAPTSLPAKLLSHQEPPMLQDPARVVPLNETQKFERHYQPNVALAPPKVRNKMMNVVSPSFKNATEDVKAPSDISPRATIDTADKSVLSSRKSVDVAKRTNGLAHTQPLYAQPSPLPRSNDLPPDLELSTTDSDTDSVTSVTSTCEVVEEARGLLRGWIDRAAASKVEGLVESLVKEKQVQEKRWQREKASLLRKMESLQQVSRYSTTSENIKQECGGEEKHLQSNVSVKVEPQDSF